MRMHRARFALAVLAVLGPGAAAGCGEAAATGRDGSGSCRSLVLVTVDTWRGDHCDVELAGVALTPRLSAFLETAVAFDDASSAGCVTAPGTAAILSGQLPRRSGVVRNDHRLPEDVPTLASLLSAAGLRSAAFVSNPVLAPGSGFERGFESYRLLPRERERARLDEHGVTAAALAWLEGLAPGERFFLWVHYVDPHGPYEPPEEELALFPRERFEARRNIPLLGRGDHSGRGGIPAYQQRACEPPSRDGRDYLARYAAEVRFWDGKLAALVEGLERRVGFDELAFVLTADHGEAHAGDHGHYFAHGQGLTQDQVHVPLVLRHPGCAAGTRVAAPVSTLDVLPTVLDLLGVAPPPEADGAHLSQAGSWPVVSQSSVDEALRDGHWKLRRRDDQRTRLFALDEDPREERDLARLHPERTARMAAVLDRLAAEVRVSEEREAAGPELEAALEGLGYR